MKTLQKLAQKIYCFKIKTLHHLDNDTVVRTVTHKIFGITL